MSQRKALVGARQIVAILLQVAPCLPAPDRSGAGPLLSQSLLKYVPERSVTF